MTDIQWDHYPLVAALPTARSWLAIQANLGRAPNTLDAYARDLDDYLAFCARLSVAPESAAKDHIALYVRDLSERPRPRPVPVLDSRQGLANATMQRRLTVVRLYYDYLMEEQICSSHPVGRGRYTPGKHYGSVQTHGLIPRFHKLPWIPNEEQWQAILAVTRDEPIRNRCMFALADDAALRRKNCVRYAPMTSTPATVCYTSRPRPRRTGASGPFRTQQQPVSSTPRICRSGGR